MPFPEWLRAAGTVVGMSALPVLELKASIPVGLAMGLPLWETFLIAVIGSTIPVPFILLFITKIFTWLKGTKHLKPFVEKMENRAMGKKEQIEKYEFWGLLLFVGIPLPGTGAWTGSLIAALLGIKFKKAFPAVILGIMLASFIMTVLSYTVIGGIFA